MMKKPSRMIEAIERFFGLNISLDKKALGKEGKPKLFLSNHISGLDSIILGHLLDTAFVGKVELSDLPVFKLLSKNNNVGSTNTLCGNDNNPISDPDAVILGDIPEEDFAGKDELLKFPIFNVLSKISNTSFIPVSKYPIENPISRGKIIDRLNKCVNLTIFPEGAATKHQSKEQRKEVKKFRYALLGGFYGVSSVDAEGNDIKLDKDIDIHPVAIHIRDDDERDAYSKVSVGKIFAEPFSSLRDAYMLNAGKKINVEVTVQPALDLKNYDRAKDLAHDVEKSVAEIVNPGQTCFDIARIKRNK